jgi:hypothetical protein
MKGEKNVFSALILIPPEIEPSARKNPQAR